MTSDSTVLGISKSGDLVAVAPVRTEDSGAMSAARSSNKAEVNKKGGR